MFVEHTDASLVMDLLLAKPRVSVLACPLQQESQPIERERRIQMITASRPLREALTAAMLAGTLLGLAGFSSAARAAAGALDTTFNATGIVTTTIIFNDTAEAVALQPDGKIVAAGNSWTANSGTTAFALTRYNANGSLDATFNTTGKVVTAVGFSSGAHSVATQPDGKIVAAGWSYTYPRTVFALIRYNANGSLDTTFNTTGKVTTVIGSGNSSSNAYSVAIQPDGKIVVAGDSHSSTQTVFSIARYNSNGTLDTTFNSSGIVTIAIRSDNRARSLTLQPDGKIVVAGAFNTGTQYVFALTRYNSNGSLDTTFNTTGIVSTAIGYNDEAYSVVMQSDGKIVTVGYSHNGTQNVFALTRHNANGSLDTTFNATGIVTTLIGTSDGANSVSIQPDGKIVAAGASSQGSQNIFALTRYNADGSLDPTFNTTGVVITLIRSFNGANSVALQPDGKIVVVGASKNPSEQFAFALMRYLGDTQIVAPKPTPIPTLSESGTLVLTILVAGLAAPAIRRRFDLTGINNHR